jgi:hypothetical protein
MADTKPVEVPETVAAPAAEPAVEAKPAETTEAPAEAPAAEAPAAETTEAAPVEEAKPVEEGTLEHKGANFPKNLIYLKQHFWFGSDAIEPKSLATYLKGEKSVETGHQNASWAAHTGKGLLFFGDKAAPSGVVNLSEAEDPTTDGAQKFTFVSKGHKHAFKAPTAAERDAWVAQIKLKIAEAKEIAASVTESEVYKSTLESLKPAKKEKAPEPVAAAEVPAAETTEEPAALEEPIKATEEAPKEEPKRRSASRKRTSIFGTLLGKKEEKKEEKAAEPAAETAPAEPAAEASTAATTEAAEVAPVEPAAETAPAATEEAPAAAEEKPAETTEAPHKSKRNSFFGLLTKKEKKVAEPAAETTAPVEEETPAPAETAPVIPPVEATTPLAVPEPTTAAAAEPAAETTTEAEPATNGAEAKKDVKEKRKSSLPFNFHKKTAVVSSDEEGEKSEKKATSPFSKLRATISRRKPSAEKPKEEAPAAAEEKPTTEEAPAPATTEIAPKADEPEEVKPPAVAPAAPVVTAAA